MSTRAAGRPRVAGSTALVPAVAKGRRLDEVLRAGAAVVGTPVAYGLATQQDKRLTRSLKDASLGDVTGAPCVPLSFDPDYCKRFDKFYALGLAITSSMVGLIAGKAGEVTFAAMAARLQSAIDTECKGLSWQRYFYEPGGVVDTIDRYTDVIGTIKLPYLLTVGGWNKNQPSMLASDYCNDLGHALNMAEEQSRLGYNMKQGTIDRWKNMFPGYGPLAKMNQRNPGIHPIPTWSEFREYISQGEFRFVGSWMRGGSPLMIADTALAPFMYLVQLFWYLATAGLGFAIDQRGNFDFMKTGLGLSITVPFATTIASKMNEIARGIASYLRMNLRTWVQGGMNVQALTSSPYLNPTEFYRLVKYDILNDDDDDGYVNPQADAGPPALEPASPAHRRGSLRRMPSGGSDGPAE